MSIVGAFSDGFNTVVGAALSRKKLEAQDEELKLLRLQRADYEGSKLYRDHQRQLELALGQADLGYKNKQTEIADLTKAMTEFQFKEDQANAPVDRKFKQERAAGAESDRLASEQARTFAAEDRPYAKALQGQNLAKGALDLQIGESNLASAKIGQTRAQVELAQALGGSIEPGAQDLMQIIEGLDIKGGDAAKATMFQVLSGAQDAKKREINDHKTFIAGQQQQAELQRAATQAETVQYIAAQGEAGVAAAKTFLGEDNPTYRAAAELVARGGLPTDRSNIDPLVLQEGKALVDQIAALNEQIRLAKQDVKRVETEGNYIRGGGRQRAVDKVQSTVTALEEQKAELTARRDEIAGSIKPKKSQPKVSIDEVGKRISANDSDDRLKTIADAYNLDLAELKRIRNAKKGK